MRGVVFFIVSSEVKLFFEIKPNKSSFKICEIATMVIFFI